MLEKPKKRKATPGRFHVPFSQAYTRRIPKNFQDMLARRSERERTIDLFHDETLNARPRKTTHITDSDDVTNSYVYGTTSMKRDE